MKCTVYLQKNGPSATGFEVPAPIVESLGAGKRPPVKVTINGFTYRTSVAVMGGVYMVGVSHERRLAAGVEGGQTVEVELELDTEPREVVVPADVQEALGADPVAKAFFEKLSYSNKSRHIIQIEGAKTPETRARRIAKSLELFRTGKV